MGSGEATRALHEATKHSYESVRRGGRFLDWDNKPNPFKAYRGLERVSLSSDPAFPRVPTGEAIRSSGRDVGGTGVPLADLNRLLWLGAGAHRRRWFGTEEALFRTYASAGALYPNEVYAATGDLDGLPAGLYHLDPAEPALTRLRSGDIRPHVLGAAAGLSEVAHAPLTLVVTGIPWRTGWKYGERGYRHLFWDAGMILANLLAVAAALDLPARVVLGFADAEVEALLGLSPPREVPLFLVALGSGARVEPASDPAEPVRFDEAALSPRVGGFPLLEEAHDAGRLATAEEVRGWRENALAPVRWGPGEAARPAAARDVTDPLDRVILRRGSARGFHPASMPLGVLGAVLDPASRPFPADVAPPAVHLFLTAHAVEDLPAGAHRYLDGRFEPLREGDFRRKSAFLSLEQRLGGESAATTFLLGDLEGALEAWGDRGYRVAQLAAGVAAGRMHLAAYGLGWGATGLTFYDDEVIRFFQPAAIGMQPLLVVAVGESAGRSDLRPVR